MKKIKSFINILFSSLVVMYLFIAPTTIFVSLKAKQNNINRQINLDYSAILELWNVDTFEGGSVSRKSWLNSRAIEFENQNKGLFIVVRDITPEQLELNLNSGIVPDMISFGIGVGDSIVNYLQEYGGRINVMDCLQRAGTKNSKLLAVPIMLGGYFCFGNLDSGDILAGENGYNYPLLSLLSNKNKIDEESYALDSFGAYEKYLSDTSKCLVGTQRDLVRINNRINNANIEKMDISILPNFSDLVQYISICNSSIREKMLCEKYIEYLLSSQVQQTISSIGMFSTTPNTCSNTKDMMAYESLLKQDFCTINVFLSDDEMTTLKQATKDYFDGNKNAIEKIEKYLCR